MIDDEFVTTDYIPTNNKIIASSCTNAILTGRRIAFCFHQSLVVEAPNGQRQRRVKAESVANLNLCEPGRPVASAAQPRSAPARCWAHYLKQDEPPATNASGPEICCIPLAARASAAQAAARTLERHGQFS